jgi:hypothetical protein
MTRFFIVPVVTEQTQRGPSREPKYRDRAGLTGVRGQVVDTSGVALIPADEVYACWFSGDTATLDDIASQSDVFDATDYLSDIVAALNRRFDRDLSLDGWLDVFGIPQE